MARLCPVCGQSLPTGLDEHAIHERLRKLAAPAISEERRTLEGQFNKRLERQRQQLKREAEHGVKTQLLAAEKRATGLSGCETVIGSGSKSKQKNRLSKP